MLPVVGQNNRSTKFVQQCFVRKEVLSPKGSGVVVVAVRARGSPAMLGTDKPADVGLREGQSNKHLGVVHTHTRGVQRPEARMGITGVWGWLSGEELKEDREMGKEGSGEARGATGPRMQREPGHQG